MSAPRMGFPSGVGAGFPAPTHLSMYLVRGGGSVAVGVLQEVPESAGGPGVQGDPVTGGGPGLDSACGEVRDEGEQVGPGLPAGGDVGGFCGRVAQMGVSCGGFGGGLAEVAGTEVGPVPGVRGLEAVLVLDDAGDEVVSLVVGIGDDGPAEAVRHAPILTCT